MRVFSSGRLGVNMPKNFSQYAQILRRGRHDVQSNLIHTMFICLINWELTSESVFECFIGLKKFR